MKRSSSKCILMIEDEIAICDMVRFVLDPTQFDLVEARHYEQAEKILAKQFPDLILLDWMLPGSSGISIIKKLRQNRLTRNIPIIMLTAKAEEEHRIKGLEAGADDYLVKPFSPRELVARIKTVLRRGVLLTPDDMLEVQSLRIDTDKHQVYVYDQLIPLSPTEYRLLLFFLTHLDRVCDRQYLLSHVWGQDSYIDERTVDVHVRRLRKLLAPFGYDKHIQTVRGSGYCYVRKL